MTLLPDNAELMAAQAVQLERPVIGLERTQERELMALEKKIMELADAYAVAASMTRGEPSLKRLIDNTTTRAALLAEVTRATDLIDDLVRGFADGTCDCADAIRTQPNAGGKPLEKSD